ncbi:MAG: hypothetical protein O7D91_21595 [Planctomycetota bacterium]|nr:hypothetical protein [Planctomycetota bacterium]
MSAPREFDVRLVNATQPALRHFAITPSDTVDFGESGGALTRGIWVGTDGDVEILAGGTMVLYRGARAGTIIPIQATRVNAALTTATGLVGMF